jgi:predicted Zn-dependent peptidase
MQVIFLPSTQVSGIVISAFVRTSPADEGRKTGVASLTARMLGGDSVYRTPALLGNDQARFGRVFTTLHDGAIEMTAFTAGDSDALYTACQTLLRDFLVAPLFTPLTFLTTRAAMQKKETTNNPPDTAENLVRLLRQQLGLGVGWEAGEVRLTLSDVVAYHKKVFCPARTAIFVTGDIAPSAMSTIEKTIRGQLSLTGWDASYQSSTEPFPTIPTIPTPAPVSARLRDRGERRGQSFATATGWLVPDKTKEDFPALRALDAILGQGKANRLFLLLRERYPLCYDVGSTLHTDFEAAFWCVQTRGAQPRGEIVGRLFEMIDVLRSGKEPITIAELDRARTFLAGQEVRLQERGHAWIQTIALAEMVGDGAETRLNQTKLLEKLTPKDVQAVVESLFTTNPATAFFTPDI